MKLGGFGQLVWVGVFGACLLVSSAPGQRRPFFHPRLSAQRPRPLIQNRPLRMAVPPVLRLAVANSDHLRYQGRRTVELRPKGKSDVHDEFVTREYTKVRIEFPSESKYAGQVIVENESDRFHFRPDRNTIEVLPPRHEETLERLSRFAEGKAGRWQVYEDPGEVVAGYRTEQVVIADPKGNIEQRLFIEPRTGILLKRQLFNAVGALTGAFTYTQVDLDPPRFDPSTFQIVRKGAKIVTPYDNLRQLAAKRGFANAFLPRSTGFRLESAHVEPMAGIQVLVQFYSQASKRVTLYQVDGAVSMDRLREFAKKDLHTRSWMDGGRTFVLIGPADDALLARLARVLGG